MPGPLGIKRGHAHTPLQASIKILPLDKEEQCQKGKRKLNFSFQEFLLISVCILVLPFNPAPCASGRFLWTLRGRGGCRRPWLRRAQAMLHLFLQPQPSILCVCPDSSSSRSSVLISGPRNLKCSSWFCTTVGFIIIILN